MRQVGQPVEDIQRFRDAQRYRVGTVILHEHDSGADIADSQQRLVTFVLIAAWIWRNVDECDVPLLSAHAVSAHGIEISTSSIQRNYQYLCETLGKWTTGEQKSMVPGGCRRAERLSTCGRRPLAVERRTPWPRSDAGAAPSGLRWSSGRLVSKPSGRYSYAMSPRQSKRELLLRTAATVVAERGYSALTLDAVGAAAGVSKGGLLYHFPTKEALVAALLEELLSNFDSGQTAAHTADPVAPGAWARAYVRASAAPPQDESTQASSVALLAAVGYDPSLLAPLQDRYRHWVERLDDDGLPGVDAHVVRLAADGLWAAELFDLAPPDSRLRARIHVRLEELASAHSGQRP